jgi:hypothetical protein
MIDTAANAHSARPLRFGLDIDAVSVREDFVALSCENEWS